MRGTRIVSDPSRKIVLSVGQELSEPWTKYSEKETYFLLA
jgi:hypothetical protein